MSTEVSSPPLVPPGPQQEQGMGFSNLPGHNKVYYFHV